MIQSGLLRSWILNNETDYIIFKLQIFKHHEIPILFFGTIRIPFVV